MSWAEDMGFDGYDIEDLEYSEEIEENWSKGFHITQKGEKLKLKEMSDFHLKNTINYFKYYLNVSFLEKELKNRR